MTDPLFYFSYAHADRSGMRAGRLNALDQGQNNAVDVFYEKLCNQVAALTARPAEEVGFFDRENLQLSTSWTNRLIDALQSAHVMVALLSPHYFSRTACGREFEVFRRRQAALQEIKGCNLDHRILPVLWVKPEVTYASIPVCCRGYIDDLQRTGPSMPDSYSSYGLMRLFDLHRTPELSAVCHVVADRIYTLFNAGRLPRINEVDFHTLESAFHVKPADGSPRPIDRMKREMRVYYLVPTRQEWSAASEPDNCDLSDQRERARPFTDAPGATIGSATEEGIAEGKPDLGVIHETLPNDLGGALDEANDSMTTSLVVFDRRALKVSNLRAVAASYAERNFENTGFVTVAGREVSDTDVDAVCGAKIGALPKLHNWDVPPGRSAYVRNVASIVVELDARLVRRQIEKFVPSGQPIPGLCGPAKI